MLRPVPTPDRGTPLQAVGRRGSDRDSSGSHPVLPRSGTGPSATSTGRPIVTFLALPSLSSQSFMICPKNAPRAGRDAFRSRPRGGGDRAPLRPEDSHNQVTSSRSPPMSTPFISSCAEWSDTCPRRRVSSPAGISRIGADRAPPIAGHCLSTRHSGPAFRSLPPSPEPRQCAPGNAVVQLAAIEGAEGVGAAVFSTPCSGKVHAGSGEPERPARKTRSTAP
jgi:hypothetical protein